MRCITTKEMWWQRWTVPSPIFPITERSKSYAYIYRTGAQWTKEKNCNSDITILLLKIYFLQSCNESYTIFLFLTYCAQRNIHISILYVCMLLRTIIVRLYCLQLCPPSIHKLLHRSGVVLDKCILVVSTKK